METGVYAALLLARAAALVMVSSRMGLIAFVSFGTDERYLGDIYYDLAKSSLNRLAWSCATELKPHGVAVIAVSPGFVRTERVHDAGHASEATESPLYAGRAIAALVADPEVLRHSGRIVFAAIWPGRMASRTRMASGLSGSSRRPDGPSAFCGLAPTPVRSGGRAA
jgi:NAD(P)-dependent dehydrogenase (short-subunit alcohol dehydrogenase family)